MADVIPSDATNKEIEWSSSDDMVVTVSQKGIVKAVSAGTAIVKAKTSEGNCEGSVNVTVENNNVFVTDIALSPAFVSLEPGKTADIQVTVEPKNADVKNVLWSSTNEVVASVDNLGKITAYKAGRTLVVAKAADGSDITGICEVVVGIPVQKITVPTWQKTMQIGESQQIRVDVTPEDATTPYVSYQSSNPEVAQIDQSGKVYARRAGTTTITIVSEDNEDATCDIKITVVTPEIAGETAAWKEVQFDPNSTWSEIKDEKTGATAEATYAGSKLSAVPNKGFKVSAVVAIPGTADVKPDFTGTLKLVTAARLGSNWNWIEAIKIPEVTAKDLKWDADNGCYQAKIEVTFGDTVNAYFDVDKDKLPEGVTYKKEHYAGKADFAEGVKESLQAVTFKCAGSLCNYNGNIYIQDVDVTDGKKVNEPVVKVPEKEEQKTQDKDTKKETLTTLQTVTTQKTEKKENVIAGVEDQIQKAYGSKPFMLNAKAKGNITYVSSDEKVVKVDVNSGKVTITGCGIATITIKASGDDQYCASTTDVVICIVPKKLSVKLAKTLRVKTLYVKWKRDKKASGYEIQYSTDKKFKKAVNVKVNKNKIVKKKISRKVAVGKTYYVRVRAYKLANGQKLYGAWSKTKRQTITR